MDHDLEDFYQNVLLFEIQYERDESWTEELQETVMIVFNHAEPGLTLLPLLYEEKIIHIRNISFN